MEPARAGHHHGMRTTIRAASRSLVRVAADIVRPVAAVIASAGTVLVALYLTAVCTTGGQLVEDAVVMGSDLAHPDPAWAQGLMATVADDRAIVVAVGLPVLMGWLRSRVMVGVIVAAAVLGANITTQVLKGLVFVRPDLVVNAQVGTGNSLPSGTVTFLLATALGVVTMLPLTRASRPLMLGLPVLAIGAGCATVALDWHRPADVLAGVMVVVAWFAVTRSALDRFTARSAARQTADLMPVHPFRRSRCSGIVAAGTIAIAPLVVIAVVPGLGAQLADHQVALYAVAQIVLAASSLLCVANALPLVDIRPSGYRIPNQSMRSVSADRALVSGNA